MADSKKLDLIFKDEKKATKNIRIPNPRADLDRQTVLPVMTKVLESKIFLTKNDLPVTAIYGAKVTDVKEILTQEDLDLDKPVEQPEG
ncbi:DUF2922 domain-containing protein [Acidaminococcus timonensis]|jgi:hypothetical protein|uniref:DUF2922 domain-containing protein n=1 Tax=Acidaminococcus timonensis TaxID=1871002 RepID=UPI003A5C0D64